MTIWRPEKIAGRALAVCVCCALTLSGNAHADWLEVLRGYDIDLSAATVETGQITIRQLQVDLIPADRHGVRAQLQGQLNGGKLQARADVQGTAKELSWDVQLQLLELAPETIPVLADQIRGGAVNLYARLNAVADRDTSPLGALSGTVAVRGGPAQLPGPSFDSAGGDLLLRILGLLNPFRDREQMSQLKCVAAFGQVREGVAHFDNSLAMETGKVLLSGYGTIGLADRSLNLMLAPRPRGDITMGAGILAPAVSVTGSLGAPRVSVADAGLVKKGLGLGAALANSSLRPLQRLQRAIVPGKPSSVCAEVLEQFPLAWR